MKRRSREQSIVSVTLSLRSAAWKKGLLSSHCRKDGQLTKHEYHFFYTKDYWKCSECEEVNPPLPRHCHRCWSLRKDWFPDDSKSCSIEPVLDKPCTEEGIDVPDGKRSKHDPPIDSKGEKCKNASPEESGATSCDSQEILGSQPSTSANSTLNSQEVVPELEREASLESCLPSSCLDPCVICQSRPKNGCIVHGRTGHLMSCYTCAKKLKKRNKLCPVCRQPIQMVVLTYFS